MATKSFRDLDEREILALAIQLEEEDARIYGDFADGLREAVQVVLGGGLVFAIGILIGSS